MTKRRDFETASPAFTIKHMAFTMRHTRFTIKHMASNARLILQVIEKKHVIRT
jgi:hypothetical protein